MNHKKKLLALLILFSLILTSNSAKAAGEEFIAPGISAIQGIVTASTLVSVPTNDGPNSAKESQMTIFGYTIPIAMDTIAIAIVKHIIERMVDSTVDWINNGFEDNPAYATDPKQFFTNIADYTAGEFILGSDLAFLCSPFQTQIKLALINSRSNRNQFQCSLTEVVGNIDAFYDDFSVGGWDGWFVMTQNSANNPYGAYMDAKIELDSRIAEAVGIQSNQLDWNSGFLSWSECIVPDPYTGECLKRSPVVKTPGTVIESQLEGVLGTGLKQLELADEFDEMIGALVGALLEETVFGVKGLFADHGSVGSGPVTSPPPPPGTPPPPALTACVEQWYKDDITNYVGGWTSYINSIVNLGPMGPSGGGNTGYIGPLNYMMSGTYQESQSLAQLNLPGAVSRLQSLASAFDSFMRLLLNADDSISDSIQIDRTKVQLGNQVQTLLNLPTCP